MKTQPPSKITQRIDYSREQIKSAITALRHQEYGLMEMLHISNEYDPRQYRLALLIHQHDIDDLVFKLNTVKAWLSEATEACEA